MDRTKELCVAGRLNEPTVGVYKRNEGNGGYDLMEKAGGEPFPFVGFKDTCQGDSGGPVWLKDISGRAVIVGVVSRGGECAAKDSPGVVTRCVLLLKLPSVKSQSCLN